MALLLMERAMSKGRVIIELCSITRPRPQPPPSLK